ncbi:MAG: four helix bundle suffix domain-containing protein [Lentisphaeria bacterium]|jgi:four helix bundle suffix protein
MNENDSLLPRHGGYKHLLSYQMAELVFDITVRFCEKYVPVADRTNDQMVQSGRSGFQNIAEGSVDSGISKKSEIKLTGIAIGCLDELAKDYRKYLQRKRLEEWLPQHPALLDLKGRQVKSLEEFRGWVKSVWEASAKSCPPDQIVANGALSLLNLALYLTRKQLAALEKKFLAEGGITERLYRLRKAAREQGAGGTDSRTHGQTRTNTDKHGRTVGG